MATEMQEKMDTRMMEGTQERPLCIPRTDIYEREDAIVIEAEMPGVSRDGVNVELKDNELTITGQARNEPVVGHRQVETEFAISDYRRVFRIEGIDPDKIDATMHYGVLRVVLPKAEELRPRKIAVKET
jgi:HSP20 family protein